MIKKIRAVICAVTLLLSALSLSSLPQFQTRANPVETKKIVLKITYPDGEWVQAGAYEGTVIRIDRSGHVLGFTPFVRDFNKGIVEVVVSKITQQKGCDSSEEIARLFINSKTESATITNPTLSIQLLSIDKVPEPTSDNNLSSQRDMFSAHAAAQPAMLPDRCCVTCGETTACSSCGVRMSCGSCCATCC